MIDLSEILSFLAPAEVTLALPSRDEISHQSRLIYGFDCFQQHCSLTGAPVSDLIDSLVKPLIHTAFVANDGKMESILDDLSIRCITQSRPSPELTRLSPKAFIALPLRTQIAYLIGRWLNPSKSLTPIGMDLIEIRRAQIRLWSLIASSDSPKDCLSRFHFKLLELDSALNLLEVPAPKVVTIEAILSIKSVDSLNEFLKTLDPVWTRAITDHSTAIGNALTRSAFLKSFISQPVTPRERPAPRPIEIANKRLADMRRKQHNFDDRKAIILADESLTPLQRARKLDLAKRAIGDLSEIASLANRATAKPTPLSARPAPKLNLAALIAGQKKES